MRKHPPTIEWTIMENDAEWERQCALLQPDNERANRRQSLSRSFWIVAALLLLLVVAGNGWRTTQDGAQQAATEVTALVQRNLSAVPPKLNEPPITEQLADRQAVAEFQATLAWQSQLARQDSGWPYGSTVDCDTPVDRSLRTVEFQGEQAVTRVITHAAHGAPAYRQTYFYHCTVSGWQRMAAPDPTRWGAERSLETSFFVYHFRQNDAPAVLAVVPQLDALYTTLRQNFGLSIVFGSEKLNIDVSVTQPPGAFPCFGAPTPIRVSSPVLYVAPVELTDTDLLAQSIALPLLEQVLAQANQQYAIKKPWQPMLNGLRLWQVWEMDLPLAAWREEVVTWIYAGLPTSCPDQGVVLPARYPALCAAHKLWLLAPTAIEIPFVCGKVAWEDFLLSPAGWYEPLIRLNQLSVPLRPGEYLEEPDSLRLTRHPGETVALAVLIEYAVATYGRERLPTLVKGLGQYESWETLLPAVYGVSVAEFEAGWQNYLATHYTNQRRPSNRAGLMAMPAAESRQSKRYD